MDMDRIKGKVQNAFGKTEEAVGEAVGSQHLSNAGAEDRMKGAAKETWGNAKDTVREMGNTAATGTSSSNASYEAGRMEGKAEVHGNNLRDRIAGGVERMRDRMNDNMDDVKDNERSDYRRTA